jgi:hypothetical protein
MQEAVTRIRLLFITLSCLATGNNFLRPEIHECYIAIDWNYCAGDVSTAQHTEGNWKNVVQCCTEPVQYIVQPY